MSEEEIKLICYMNNWMLECPSEEQYNKVVKIARRGDASEISVALWMCLRDIRFTVVQSKVHNYLAGKAMCELYCP